MKNYKHLMVSLDLSEIDGHLMNFARFLTREFESDKVTFVHVLKDWDVPDEVEELIDVPSGGLDELLKNELKERVNGKFESEQTEAEVKILHGKTIVYAIEDEVKASKPDILLVGNKNTYSGSGYASTKIMENLDLPILLVPETAYLSVNNILLPIDFSKHSVPVVNTGYALAEELEAEKKAIHIMHLPKLFFPYIPEKVAFREAQKKAEKEFRDFKQKLKDKKDLTCEYIPSGEYGIARSIYKYAIKHQFDLIVIGARGKTVMNIARIGGVAYRLADLDMHVPLLILK